MASNDAPRTLFACALDVLTTADAADKADKTSRYVSQWQSGEIAVVSGASDDVSSVPDRPARPANVAVVPPKQVKQGSRKAFVHSLVHAESFAIDLMWDMVARFVALELPRAFYDDWVRIAGEEAQHYRAWDARLTELGAGYGDLAAHDGLWDSAFETRGDAFARLAVVHLVHEARGLDVFPAAVARFEKSGDATSLAILRKNCAEETTHVGAGVRWFRFLCERDGVDPAAKFQQIVPQYFHGALKPPFNKTARDEAGLFEDWYLPLSVASKDAGVSSREEVQ